MPRQITAFSNSTVKRLRSLRDKKARREEGLFLAEGLRILAEARDSGRLPEIIAFSAQGAAHPLATEIITAAETAGAKAIEVPPDLLSKMSGKDNPQMLLGAYRQPSSELAAIDRGSAALISIESPRAAPSIISPMIEVPQTLLPSLATSTAQGSSLAMVTNFALARA